MAHSRSELKLDQPASISSPISPRKRALITGGTRGIGLAAARALASAGFDLALAGKRALSEVHPILDDLALHGADVAYFSADLSDPDQPRRLFDVVRERCPHLNLLVNNAGITSPGRSDILSATPDSFDHVLSVNLKAPFFLTQLVANWMIEQRSATPDFAGTIIFVTSISAEVPSPNRGDYCLSKAALAMAVKLWAARLAEFSIPVYEVRPGIIRTDMTTAVTEKYDRLFREGLTPEARWGTPEDVANAISLLASGKLTYATGQILHVSGGWHSRPL